MLREKLKNHNPNNIIMPPQPTPTLILCKQWPDEHPVELDHLEAEADECITP